MICSPTKCDTHVMSINPIAASVTFDLAAIYPDETFTFYLELED